MVSIEELTEKFGAPIAVAPWGECIVIQGTEFDPDWEAELGDLGFRCHFGILDGHAVTFVQLKKTVAAGKVIYVPREKEGFLMNRTKIEYLDYTWNPVVGCSGVDCAVRKHCWARGQAKRRMHVCQDCYDFKPHFHIERVDQPLHLKKPSRIGVCFMGDLFDDEVNFLQLIDIFQTMWKASWHTFIMLTKHPENIFCNLEFYPNMWLGVSVNCKHDLDRIDELKGSKAEVKFVSFEPLYEDLGAVDLSGIDWVIVGAQRRPDLQPEKDWVSRLIIQAQTAGALIFLKNNLACKNQYALPPQEIPEVSR